MGKHFRSTPSKAKKTGRGWRMCQASGFIRSAKYDHWIQDVRQGYVLFEKSDFNFHTQNTYHPQDLRKYGAMDDPLPIPYAQPEQNPCWLTPQDLKISDAEREQAVREGRSVMSPQSTPERITVYEDDT